MNIAIDTFSYYMHFGKHCYEPENPVDIRWYCEISKKLGVNGLHIDPYHINSKKDITWVRDFAGKNNMYIELGASGTSMAELRPAIKTAGELGANLLRTFAGGDCLNGRQATAKRAGEAKKQLSEVLPFAESNGIKIALENHGDLYIEDILTILDLNSDYLGVCFDSGNFAFTGEDPLEGINAFRKKILCTHLKDVCPKDKYPAAKPFNTVNEPVHFCGLGEGYLPVKEIVQQLRDNEIENLTLEICSPLIKTMSEHDLLKFEEENVIKSIEFIRNSGF